MATKGALISESRIWPTLGMAKCSSYLHFRSKADLIRASFEELRLGLGGKAGPETSAYPIC